MSGSEVELTVDRSRCVLCGEPNECALEKGEVGEGEVEVSRPCWCVEQSFPDSLLAVATDQDGGDSCICRRCLEKTRGSANQP